LARKNTWRKDAAITSLPSLPQRLPELKRELPHFSPLSPLSDCIFSCGLPLSLSLARSPLEGEIYICREGWPTNRTILSLQINTTVVPFSGVIYSAKGGKTLLPGVVERLFLLEQKTASSVCVSPAEGKKEHRLKFLTSSEMSVRLPRLTLNRSGLGEEREKKVATGSARKGPLPHLSVKTRFCASLPRPVDHFGRTGASAISNVSSCLPRFDHIAVVLRGGRAFASPPTFSQRKRQSSVGKRSLSL